MTTAVLKLELIGDDFFWADKRGLMQFPEWLRYMSKLGTDKAPSEIVQLVSIDEANNVRIRYRQPVRDYSRANATGSRGIFGFWFLEQGIYEVRDRYKVNKVRRYIIRVAEGRYKEISRDEAIRCLRSTTLE